MKLSINLLLPAFIVAARAASETAKVYILQNPDYPSSSTVPTLTPEEARLVIAQRLGVTQYHSLHHATDDALKHINVFGGQTLPLFGSDGEDDGQSHLVVVIENSATLSHDFQELRGSFQPAFEIANPPSSKATLQLVKDLNSQNRIGAARHTCSDLDEVNPFKEKCWASRAKIIHLDSTSNEQGSDVLRALIASIINHVQSGSLDAMVVFMPESSQSSKSIYGSYEMPLLPLNSRNIQSEEPVELSETPQLSASNPIIQQNFTRAPPGTFASCYPSNDSCQAATNNCSGHGYCYQKFKSEDKLKSCYTCGCKATIKFSDTKNGKKQAVTYWGGPACSKRDISGQFWLLAIISVILMAVVSSGVGMLFSIGEEKLPGVIGAGVSGPKAR